MICNWWQLKHFLCLPRSLGRWSNSTSSAMEFAIYRGVPLAQQLAFKMAGIFLWSPPRAERCVFLPNTLPETNIVPENGWLEDDFFFGSYVFWNVWVVFVRLGSVFFAICFYFAPVYHGIHHSLPWASSPSCTTVWEHFFGGQFFRQHQTSKSKQKVSGGEFLSKCQARTSLVSQMQRLRRKQRRRRGGNKGQQLDFETRIETTYKTWMHHYSHLTSTFFSMEMPTTNWWKQGQQRTSPGHSSYLGLFVFFRWFVWRR